MKLKEIYKQILFEGRTKSIGKDQVVSHLESDNFNYNPGSTYIERYIDDFDSDYGIVRPSNYVRKSQNTENYYTLIVDNSERWSQYPKRSRSIIGRTHERLGSVFDHVVIPQVGANIGVCPDYDFWDSFYTESGLRSMERSFNKPLDILAAYAQSESPDDDFGPTFSTGLIPDDGYSEFKSYIDSIDEAIKNDPEKSYEGFIKRVSNKKIKLIVDYYTSEFDDLFEFLDYKLDPSRNNFTTETYTSDFEVPDDREIWTDAPCLLIENSEIRDINSHLKS